MHFPGMAIFPTKGPGQDLAWSIQVPVGAHRCLSAILAIRPFYGFRLASPHRSGVIGEQDADRADEVGVVVLVGLLFVVRRVHFVGGPLPPSQVTLCNLVLD